MTTPAPTISLYLRLSSAADDTNTGLRSQEADLRDLAARHGLTVVAVHTDDGLSGALRQRPAFLAWLADAREGRAGHLGAWKLDRVSRGSLQGLARFLDVLEGLDDDGVRVRQPVRFLTVADNLDSTSASWDLQVAVLGALAKQERENTRTRMLRHREANRTTGRVVGGRRAWAFKTTDKVGGGLRLVPVPKHADAVRAALDLLRAGGTLGDVARDWARRGLTPKSGTTWHRSPLRRILSNPNLYGATTHHGELVREADGTARIDADQAILTMPEWFELQALLAARSTSRLPSSPDASLLAGVLTCVSCSRTLYPHRPAAGRTATYRCRGVGCSQPVSISMAQVEDYLVAEFRDTLGVERATDLAPEPESINPAEVASLTEAIAAADKALRGDLGDDDALAVIRQRRELRDRLAKAQDVATHGDIRPLVAAGTYGERFDAAATTGERNAVLRMAFDTVFVRPGTRGGTHDDPAQRLTFVGRL